MANKQSPSPVVNETQVVEQPVAETAAAPAPAAPAAPTTLVGKKFVAECMVGQSIPPRPDNPRDRGMITLWFLRPGDKWHAAGVKYLHFGLNSPSRAWYEAFDARLPQGTKFIGTFEITGDLKPKVLESGAVIYSGFVKLANTAIRTTEKAIDPNALKETPALEAGACPAVLPVADAPANLPF